MKRTKGFPLFIKVGGVVDLTGKPGMASASLTVASSWNSNAWLSTHKPHHTSLKKTIHAYKSISQKLKTKLNQLTQRKDELGSKAFIMVDEIAPGLGLAATAGSPDATTPTTRPPAGSPPLLTPSSPDIQPSPAVKLEGNDYHHSTLSSLASTVTNICIESTEIRLAYVNEALNYLGSLYHDNPKQRTPPELMLSRYNEWVQTNQRLFELNSRLYDLEKIKFDIQRREREAAVQQSNQGREEFDHTGACWND